MAFAISQGDSNSFYVGGDIRNSNVDTYMTITKVDYNLAPVLGIYRFYNDDNNLFAVKAMYMESPYTELYTCSDKAISGTGSVVFFGQFRFDNAFAYLGYTAYTTAGGNDWFCKGIYGTSTEIYTFIYDTNGPNKIYISRLVISTGAMYLK